MSTSNVYEESCAGGKAAPVRDASDNGGVAHSHTNAGETPAPRFTRSNIVNKYACPACQGKGAVTTNGVRYCNCPEIEHAPGRSDRAAIDENIRDMLRISDETERLRCLTTYVIIAEQRARQEAEFEMRRKVCAAVGIRI